MEHLKSCFRRICAGPKQVDRVQECDYNGLMIINLRNSKARLSELVEIASGGEDVLITVRGKVKARLTRAVPEVPYASKSAWIEERRAQLAMQQTLPAGTMQEAIDEDRLDRL